MIYIIPKTSKTAAIKNQNNAHLVLTIVADSY